MSETEPTLAELRNSNVDDLRVILSEQIRRLAAGETTATAANAIVRRVKTVLSEKEAALKALGRLQHL